MQKSGIVNTPFTNGRKQRTRHFHGGPVFRMGYLLHDDGLHVLQHDLQSFFSLEQVVLHTFLSAAAKELVPEISMSAIIPANIFFILFYLRMYNMDSVCITLVQEDARN
ncbi:MAG: hypothetical protein V4539_14000 [Bacteroidota bacterium]